MCVSLVIWPSLQSLSFHLFNFLQRAFTYRKSFIRSGDALGIFCAYTRYWFHLRQKSVLYFDCAESASWYAFSFLFFRDFLVPLRLYFVCARFQFTHPKETTCRQQGACALVKSIEDQYLEENYGKFYLLVTL